MRVTINGVAYECATAGKTENAVFLYDEQGREVSAFAGIRDMSIVTLEGGTWLEPVPTEDERRDAQIFYTAMMTDTLLEEVSA